jgi:hypothetical protein
LFGLLSPSKKVATTDGGKCGGHPKSLLFIASRTDRQQDDKQSYILLVVNRIAD